MKDVFTLKKITYLKMFNQNSTRVIEMAFQNNIHKRQNERRIKLPQDFYKLTIDKIYIFKG